ncbi:MAG: acetyl/propionyl/methylcrotonyl-CoA carboxylase subunit alpha [Gammaproteobacteria bacterium]|nr:acetyl/propionyl/methylcrotonyl-CoA carboxylase subunit alpha [Gammaproteobacteria bacterium]
MFKRILIANRGEIACRIARTAGRLGIQTVGVYSDADADALHTRAMDLSVHIGPAPARDSYLNVDRIIKAAKDTGCQAIHPGYGFLSENAGLARACADNGLTFIGPPPDAIEAMGSKIRAKQIMENSGIPLVPGYHGEDQSTSHLQAVADGIGYPVLIKASAGGGGKGMRVVRDSGDFASALEGARRESSSAFGDDKVLIEKYLHKPRHVEVQVFRDNFGACVHLFERDCSIQRRHQKILEEAPAPGLDEVTRRRMGEAAVRAADAIDYRGAGTVEFIMNEAGDFFFMEMNTRLQVEHPVTELVTGQDLVAWQLRVAAGEPLPCGQDELQIHGHAFEARVYAENPAREFLPSTGRLTLAAFPEQDEYVRVDAGVQTGDIISVHYDPMIAKIITWGPDRRAALERLHGALGETRIAGVETNVEFLLAVLEQDEVAEGGADTHFVEQHLADLVGLEATPPTVLVLAAFHEIASLANRNRRLGDADPFSAVDGWRPNLASELRFEYGDAVRSHECRLVFDRTDMQVIVDDDACRVQGELMEDGRLTVVVDGLKCEAHVVQRPERLDVFFQGRHYGLTRRVDTVSDTEAAAADRITAPMPGRITAVNVKAGDRVERGAVLLTLEAMKMEHSLAAPRDGVIERIPYQAGDSVAEGAELVIYEES